MGVKFDPGYVRFGHMPLAKLIMTAYGVRRDQLVGPDWLLEPDMASSFDIDAKLPPGSAPDQMPLMLQSLLEERFKLAVRKGSQGSDAYALVVGAGGPRFSSKEASVTPQGWRDDSVSASDVPGASTLRLGATTVTTLPGRMIRVDTTTMAGLVDFLHMHFDLPVIDKTGLGGNFDIRMDVELLPSTSAPLDASDVPAAGRVAAVGTAAAERVRASCLAALQKLGLKLERQKIPVETIVIEHVEKTPTEN
jgi:uncharacterized protein (TIGR03435 family)